MGSSNDKGAEIVNPHTTAERFRVSEQEEERRNEALGCIVMFLLLPLMLVLKFEDFLERATFINKLGHNL